MAPTGTCNVTVNGSVIASNVVIDANGNGSATWNGTGVLGPFTLGVAYSGDGNFNPGSGTATENIQEPTKSNVIVTVTPTPNPAAPNTPVTINFNVASA